MFCEPFIVSANVFVPSGMSQLLGEIVFCLLLCILFSIRLNENLDLKGELSFNLIENNIPNRRQNTISPSNWDIPEGPKSFAETLNGADNHRFYQTLDENEMAANLNGVYKFKYNEDIGKHEGKLSFGYQGKMKEVDFGATQFNFRITKRDANNKRIVHPLITDVYNLDNYFNLENRLAGLFSIETFRGKLHHLLYQ